MTKDKNAAAVHQPWYETTATSTSAEQILQDAIQRVTNGGDTRLLEIGRCEKCLSLYREGKSRLCKRCYIRKYGEWSNL